MLGGGDRVAGRRVDDGDPGAGGRLQVHVVDADACPADDHEPGARGDQRGVRLDLAPDDERVVVADDGEELVRPEAEPLVDVVMRREAGRRPRCATGSATRILMRPRRLPSMLSDRRTRGRDLRGGDRGAGRRTAGPRYDRRHLERAHGAEDLLDASPSRDGPTEDLAGQLALAAGQDDAPSLDLAVEGLPVEVLGDRARP